MITGKSYIGNSLSAKGNVHYKTINPELNLENGTDFVEATSEEVDEAVSLASKAYKQYSKVSGKQKALFLNAIADEILELGDVLLSAYCSESGLPIVRAKGERDRTVGQLRSFAELVNEGSWVDAFIETEEIDRLPTPKPDLRKMLIPIGPIVVFGASNFPLAYSTAGGDTVSALAAGCPVIVKSHPMHAGTGELVASAVIKAVKKSGMPNGVFSNINSSGIEVGAHLVKHPLVKGVGFTGSTNGGRALFDLASKRAEPIPVFAEMGSVNPVVILPNALENRGEQLGEIYANSITVGTGQFCTNPGLIIGIRGVGLDKFTSSLGKEILKVNPMCMVHPAILKAYNSKKERALSHVGVSAIANYLDDVSENYAQQGVFTVSGDVFLGNSTLHQEVFGPFSIVVQCKDKKQLEQVVSELEGQLTGTIISDNGEEASFTSLINILQTKVGRLVFNGVPTGVEVSSSMNHGGPYPASTDSRFTAVGVHSIKRWVRPISFQNWPNALLPQELQNENLLEINRVVNGKRTTRKI